MCLKFRLGSVVGPRIDIAPAQMCRCIGLTLAFDTCFLASNLDREWGLVRSKLILFWAAEI